MVVKLDDEIGVSKADVEATRAATTVQQQQTQPQPQPQAQEPRVVQAVSGRPGQPDAVLVEYPDGTVSAGASTDYGPTVQQQASKYIQTHAEEQPGDSKAAIQKQAVPVFQPSGQKVRVDDLPQGTDFEATRQRLLKIPDGTQVQIGDSSNEDVYAWQGGLVNRKGEYYTGYGGVTAGMAADYRQREAEAAREMEKKDDAFSVAPSDYRKATMNLIMSGNKSLGEPDPTTKMVLGGREYADPLNAMYWYGLGGKINEAYDKLAVDVLNKSDQLKQMGIGTGIPRPVMEFAVGFDRSIVGAFAGLPTAAGAIIGLGEAGVQDALAGRVGKLGTMYAGVPDVWTKGFEGSVTSVPGMLVTGAAPSLFKESPDYLQGAGEAAGFFSVLALGGAMGAKGVSVKGATVKASIGDVGAGASKTLGKNVGARTGKSGSKTPFDTSYIEDLKSRGTASGRARAAAYDSGQKISNVFESPAGEKVYADLVNEQAGGEAIPVDPWKNLAEKGRASMDANNVKIESANTPIRKTVEINKKLVYTQSEMPTLKPFKDTDMNWAKAQENISISIGKSKKTFTFKENMKGFFGNEKASVQLLEPLERITSRSSISRRTVNDMIYNPATKSVIQTQKIRSRFNYGSILGGGIATAGLTGMLTGSGTRQDKGRKQIIGPGPLQKVPIPPIGINDLIVKPGQWQPQKTRTYPGTPQPQPGRGSSDIMTLSIGAGILGGMAASKMLSPGRLKGLGGDFGGFRMPRGIGMKNDKYLTGDVTGLIFGKKKRKAKRR